MTTLGEYQHSNNISSTVPRSIMYLLLLATRQVGPTSRDGVTESWPFYTICFLSPRGKIVKHVVYLG